jgi:HlyD family secretion protein
MDRIRQILTKIPHRLLLIILAGIAALLLGLLARGDTDRREKAGPEATFVARRGPLTINVLEAGTIKAREQVIIKNEVEGTTTILWIIEEGTRVRKGELLIELDASRLESSLIDQQIKVQNSEANFVRVRENLDVIRNQAASDLERAELNLRFAGEDLRKYVEGEYPKEQKEAQARITLAEEELQRARDKVTWSKVLYEEKYLSQSELQADELAAKKASLDLELAQANLELLEQFTHGRKLASLESEVRQTGMALERARRKAGADVVQAEAELRARSSELEREEVRLVRALDQIAKTRIKAPADGLVIYATTAQGSWRGNTEPLTAGQGLRERQEIIYLPRTSSMLAEVKLHEANLGRIREGLEVVVTVDALPGRKFSGRVDSISPLPDGTAMWLNPDLKVYNTMINLEGESAGLRTGMSCRAEILIEQLEDAVHIPLQAVLRVEGQATVWVDQGEGYRPRPVTVGLDNNRMVEIVEGLEAGERVLLNPPLSAGKVGEEPKNRRAGGERP